MLELRSALKGSGARRDFYQRKIHRVCNMRVRQLACQHGLQDVQTRPPVIWSGCAMPGLPPPSIIRVRTRALYSSHWAKVSCGVMNQVTLC